MRGRRLRQLWVYGLAGVFVVAVGLLLRDLFATSQRTVVSLTFDNDTISQYTLGLIGLVVNGLLLWLTSWVASEAGLPFHVSGFWAAFWGAIIVGVVGWLLNLTIREPRLQRESDQA